MSAPTLDVPALVAEREKLLAWLKPAQAREMEIRRQLAPYFFPNPIEGTQHVERDGFEVALKHTLTRKLDEPALASIMPQMPEQFRNVGVLIKYSAGLVLEGYRALSDEHRLIFDEALTISEGAPALEIKPKAAPGGVLATVAGGVLVHSEPPPVAGAGSERTESKLNADLEKSFKRVEKANKTKPSAKKKKK